MKSSRILWLVVAVTLSPWTQTQANEATQQFVHLMNQYLDLADQVVDSAQRSEMATFLALEGAAEIYKKRSDYPGAERYFLDLLERHGKNPTTRNLIRFKLRELYDESGQLDKALQQMDLVIQENS